MNKECQCDSCKYSRGEITFNEFMIIENSVLDKYEYKIDNMKDKKGKTWRNGRDSWCEAEYIRASCDEMQYYLYEAEKKEKNYDQIFYKSLFTKAKRIMEKCDSKIRVVE